jgi:hypothetical protein
MPSGMPQQPETGSRLQPLRQWQSRRLKPFASGHVNAIAESLP